MRRAVAVLVLALLAGCGGSAADDAETGADPAVEDLAALVATGELRRLVDGGIDDLAAAGDVDDDGLADFLLTRVNPEADYEREILLVRGSREPWPPAPSMAEVRARSIVLRRTGPAEAIRGRGVDAAGDIDRDGFDDNFVLRPFGAAPGWGGDTGTPGVVHLIHGAPDLPPEISLDEPPAGVRMALFASTKVTSTHLALDVATGGDLNGDRVPDLVFGAGFSESENPTTQYGTGRAYVLFGGPPLEGTIDVEEVGMSRPGFILEGEADGDYDHLARVAEWSAGGDGADGEAEA
ncbi:MAG: hypothetical protein F9K43_25355 [Bauldia sp.]|nr:MAG: hypothetical protein F9K43_25355 [Bauldia sp.]